MTENAPLALRYDAHDDQPSLRRAETPQRQRPSWLLPRRTVIVLIVTVLMPVLMGAGMALAYLGAFHKPTPDHLPIAVVAADPAQEVVAQRLSDARPGALDVRTVADSAAAQHAVATGAVAGAVQWQSDRIQLWVATADGGALADVLRTSFLDAAASSHLPLVVDDVAPTNENDPTGQGMFFVLVALSVGAYASAIAISAVLGRASVVWRLVVPVAVSFVIASVVTIVAGPVYHVVEAGIWAVWLLSWLYAAGVIFVGVALHAVFRHWTTLVLAGLFVMLNFTSSGGVFARWLLPPFFQALNAFWDGAAFVHAGQVVTYLTAQSMGCDALVLTPWAVVGVALVVLTHRWSEHRSRIADELTRVRSSEEAVAA